MENLISIKHNKVKPVEYKKENSNQKLALKKQALIKRTIDKENKLQNQLDHTKNDMTIQQQELSEFNTKPPTTATKVSRKSKQLSSQRS